MGVGQDRGPRPARDGGIGVEVSGGDYRAIIMGIARTEEAIHHLTARVAELKSDHEKNAGAHWKTINDMKDDVGEIKQRMVAIEERGAASQRHAVKMGGGAGAAAGGIISFLIDALVRAVWAK